MPEPNMPAVDDTCCFLHVTALLTPTPASETEIPRTVQFLFVRLGQSPVNGEVWANTPPGVSGIDPPFPPARTLFLLFLHLLI
jgi:hypothetical protein